MPCLLCSLSDQLSLQVHRLVAPVKFFPHRPHILPWVIIDPEAITSLLTNRSSMGEFMVSASSLQVHLLVAPVKFSPHHPHILPSTGIGPPLIDSGTSPMVARELITRSMLTIELKVAMKSNLSLDRSVKAVTGVGV